MLGCALVERLLGEGGHLVAVAAAGSKPQLVAKKRSLVASRVRFSLCLDGVGSEGLRKPLSACHARLYGAQIESCRGLLFVVFVLLVWYMVWGDSQKRRPERRRGLKEEH